MASKTKNRVGFLLDETGSMMVRRDETIVAVNNYFETLRQEKAIVTFATFDTAQGVNFREINTKAKKVVDLTEESYVPNAMTPLYDAVGKMIIEMERHSASGDKVLICIVTDGQENSSLEFDLAKIRSLIAQRESDGWAFAFIGATADAWDGGANIGIAQDAVLNVKGNQMKGAMIVNSAATGDYFAGRVSGKRFYSDSRHLVKDD